MAGEADKTNELIRTAMASVLKEQGLTAGDLAKRLGKTRSYGYQLTSGERSRVPDSLVTALDALDLELVVQPKSGKD